MLYRDSKVEKGNREKQLLRGEKKEKI